MLKKLFTKKIKVPILGDFSIKDSIRWAFLAVMFGVIVFGAIRLPYVGGYVSTGMAKIRGWFAWNQA